ncbi:hypothetical protein FSP39_010672 [Pinctada imbricata]|uniref:Uncharacterized protein n=1 Tax=Pinctada imbricata TaxID=66713 RepID=A0AA89BZ79_PINIB|nr:hypothetical protein FSP39_010672 [Pinctada imbricata]
MGVPGCDGFPVESTCPGYKKLWHSGGIVNYSSLLWLFPDKNVGVYVTITGAEGNRKGPAIFPITSRAADILLNEEPWLNKTTGCSYPDPWSETKEIVRANNTLHKYAWNITRNASDYAGIYSNPAYADMTIKVETGPKLKLYFGRFGVFSLYPITEEKFDAYLEGPLSYVTNSDDNTAPFHLEFIVDSSQVTKLKFPFIPADSIVELVKKNSKNQGSSANSVPNLHSNRFMKYVSIIDMFFVFLFPVFVSFFS